MVTAQPKLVDLQRLSAKVPSYPISADELVELAQEQSGSDVVDFYLSFPSDAIFSDQDDLLARSEQIEIMNQEEQPDEILVSAEED